MNKKREYGIADILKLTKVGKATIYRWIDRHPTMVVADLSSLTGHPFPRHVRKEGREVLWDAAEVEKWWAANADIVGRHPSDGPTVIMKWEKFRQAMMKRPREFEAEDGTVTVEDDMEMVVEFSRLLGNVRVKFASLDEAVLFRLKYS